MGIMGMKRSYYQKPTPEKYCSSCGKKLERKRFNGRLEDYGVFLRRKYCGRECASIGFRKESVTLSGDEDVKTFEEYVCVWNAGTNTIVAKYAGDENNESAESAPYTFTGYYYQILVLRSPWPDYGPINMSEPIEMILHIYGEAGPPTGTVTFTADTSCTATLTTPTYPIHPEFIDSVGSGLDAAEAVCSVSFDTVHENAEITVTYSGDSTYYSDTETYIYNKTGFVETITTILGVYPNPPVHTQNIDVIVKVEMAGSSPTGGLLDKYALTMPQKNSFLTPFMTENYYNLLLPIRVEVGYVNI